MVCPLSGCNRCPSRQIKVPSWIWITYHIDLLKLYHENTSESVIPVDALGSEDNSSINNVSSFEFDDDNLCVNSIAY